MAYAAIMGALSALPDIDDRREVLAAVAAAVPDDVAVRTAPTLTDGERMMLMFTADGRTDLEIGELTEYALPTIRHFQVSLRRKMGAVNRAHAVHLAHRWGMIR